VDPRGPKRVHLNLRIPKDAFTCRQFSAQLIPQNLEEYDLMNGHDPGRHSVDRTLSQSIFCLVNGSALLNPLKVLSPISWYALFKDVWYFPSSSSIRASIFEADALVGLFVREAGSVIETSCVVES